MRYTDPAIEREYMENAHDADSALLALARFAIAVGGATAMTVATCYNVLDSGEFDSRGRHDLDAPWHGPVAMTFAVIGLLFTVVCAALSWNGVAARLRKACCEGDLPMYAQAWMSELLCVSVLVCMVCARTTVEGADARAGWLIGFDTDNRVVPARTPRIIANTLRYGPLPIYLALLPTRLVTLAPAVIVSLLTLILSSAMAFESDAWHTVTPYGSFIVWSAEAIVAIVLARAWEERRRSDYEQRVRGIMREYYTGELVHLQGDIIARCSLVSAEQEALLRSNQHRVNTTSEFRSEAVVVSFRMNAAMLDAKGQLDAKGFLLFAIESTAAALRTDLIRYSSCGDLVGVAIGLMPAQGAPEVKIGHSRKVPTLKTHCVLACLFIRTVFELFRSAATRQFEATPELRVGAAAGRVVLSIMRGRGNDAAAIFPRTGAGSEPEPLSRRLHVSGRPVRLAHQFVEDTTAQTARISHHIIYNVAEFYKVTDRRQHKFEDVKSYQATLALPDAPMRELEEHLAARIAKAARNDGSDVPPRPFVLEHKVLLDTMAVDTEATMLSTVQQYSAGLTTADRATSSAPRLSSAGPPPTIPAAMAISRAAAATAAQMNGSAAEAQGRAGDQVLAAQSSDMSALPHFGPNPQQGEETAGGTNSVSRQPRLPGTSSYISTAQRDATRLVRLPRANLTDKPVVMHCTTCGWKFSDEATEAQYHYSENEGFIRLAPVIGQGLMVVGTATVLLVDMRADVAPWSWLCLIAALAMLLATFVMLYSRRTPGWKRFAAATLIFAPLIGFATLGIVAFADDHGGRDGAEFDPAANATNATALPSPPPPTLALRSAAAVRQNETVGEVSTPTTNAPGAAAPAGFGAGSVGVGSVAGTAGPQRARLLFDLLMMLSAHTVLPVVPSRIPAIIAVYVTAPWSWLASQHAAHADVYTSETTVFDAVPLLAATILYAGVFLGVRFSSRRAFLVALDATELITMWQRQRLRFRAVIEVFAPALVARRFIETLDRPNGVQVAKEYEEITHGLTRVSLSDASVLIIDAEPKDLKRDSIQAEMSARQEIMQLIDGHPQARAGSEYELFSVEHGTGWAVVAGINTDPTTGAPRHTRLERESILQDIGETVSRHAAVKQSLRLFTGIGSGELECDLLGGTNARFEIAGYALIDAISNRNIGTGHLAARVRSTNRRAPTTPGVNLNLSMSSNDGPMMSTTSVGSARRGRSVTSMRSVNRGMNGSQSVSSPSVAGSALNSLSASDNRRRNGPPGYSPVARQLQIGDSPQPGVSQLFR